MHTLQAVEGHTITRVSVPVDDFMFFMLSKVYQQELKAITKQQPFKCFCAEEVRTERQPDWSLPHPA